MEAAGRQTPTERQVMAGSRGFQFFPKAANENDRVTANVSYAGSIPKGSLRPTPVMREFRDDRLLHVHYGPKAGAPPIPRVTLVASLRGTLGDSTGVCRESVAIIPISSARNMYLRMWPLAYNP